MKNSLDIEQEYKEKVLEVWRKHNSLELFSNPENEYRKHPLLPKTVSKNCILFIGVNPSFTLGSIIPDNELDIGFYETSKKIEFKDISYFEKMKEIANYCKTEWTHLDLFFIRETNQKIIENLTYSNIDFLNDQLEISFDIIEKANPKIIIVSNAFASEFFGKLKSKHKGFNKIWRGYDLSFEGNDTTFNNEIGTYEIEMNNRKIPIILSGMLSGQRALDIGTFERLKWQTKMILNKKSK